MEELEAKFYVRDLSIFPEMLETNGARVLRPRVHETNLRFDTPDKDLNREKKLLRLRQAHNDTMTFKSAARVTDGASLRQEIQTEVKDFEAAKMLLEALGYQVSRIYEKYRTEYQSGKLIITLDELPYGNFIEIEGPHVAEIQGMAQTLGLDWDANITDNYLILFDHLRGVRGFDFRDLTFDNFKGLSIPPQELGIRAAG